MKVIATFGDRLGYALDKKGMTQTELAKRINSNRQTINNYINTDRLPKMSTMKNIAEALDVNIAFLLGFDVDMNGEPITSENKLLHINEVHILCEALSKSCERVRICSKKHIHEISERLGWSNKEILDFETAEKIPPSTYIIRLCNFCDFSLNDFHKDFEFNYNKLKIKRTE